ncbi:MAG: preprotein translocase subunit SecE [Solirubrobacterales bacterium]
MARDRKRAKQRRERRAPRGAAAAAHTELHRADLPGALEHASGEVDEFDAALIRGAGGEAGGIPIPPDAAPKDAGAPDGDALGEREALETEAQIAANIEPERALPEMFLGGARIEHAPGGGGPPTRGGNGVALEPADGGGAPESAGRAVEPRERRRLPARAVAFLRASWAELQRVQWPDRPQVSQATAVVLGFVAIAGFYLGAADWVAQKVVNFIL